MYFWLLKNTVLPIADKVMGTSITAKLKQIQLMREWNREKIEEWQNQKLSEIIHHAYDNTIYYKQLFDEQGLKPSDIESRTDLSKIPILTKNDIRQNFEEIIPRNIHSIPYKKASTGGSTGSPLKYYHDYDSWSFTNANTIINWEKASYKYGDKFIALGSSSLFIEKKKSFKHKIYYRLKNKIGLNGINMSNYVCRNYLKIIRKEKVRFLYGYASSIYLLAKYAYENNEEINLEACFTTSEVLTSHFWDTINKAFNCKIVDCYGANDGGITAFAHIPGCFEAGYDTVFWTDSKNSYNMGSVLVTDLFNYAMPFINYKSGDEIIVDDKINQNYGYNGQIINKVLGRSSDIIELENGNVLTGPGFTILFKDLPVEYYCVEKKGINSILCHINKLDGYSSKHEDVIISTFKKQMGVNSNFKINYTNSVFLSKSGKRQYFKN